MSTRSFGAQEVAPSVVAARSGTIDRILTRSAATHADKSALVFGDRSWTYRELDRAVDAVAGELLSLGLAPGDRVAALGVNSDAYVIAFLACVRAGLVHVPVNHALRSAELRHLLEDSGSVAALVDPELVGPLEEAAPMMQNTVLLRDGDGSLLDRAMVGESGRSPSRDATGEDLAQLLYTSGTTSKPKGAMMTHRALMFEYISCILALDFTEDDRPLVCMPMYHSAGMHVFTLPYLAVGATITVLERPDIPTVLRTIEQASITSLFLAPTVWVPLSSHPDVARYDLSTLTKAQYGASIMPTTVLARLRELLPEVGFYNCFGQSEIGPLATVLGPAEHDEHPASCGREVRFVELRVVDAEGNEVEAGERGEIVYRSPQLCDGYWGLPEATSEAFVDGWFHSGDLAVRDADGFITIVDRIKDVINTGGILVASREIEDVLYTHPAVAEVAVVGVADERWIEAVTAVVTLHRTATAPTEDDIIDHVRSRVAAYKVPKRVFFVDELPRNQSGKLLKRVVRASLESGSKAAAS